MNLAIIFGGTSSEREVSLNTGRAILKSLKEQDGISSIDFTGNYNILLNELEIKDIDLVFNALHGGDGENGTFQLFLEKNDINYIIDNINKGKID